MSEQNKCLELEAVNTIFHTGRKSPIDVELGSFLVTAKIIIYNSRYFHTHQWRGSIYAHANLCDEIVSFFLVLFINSLGGQSLLPHQLWLTLKVEIWHVFTKTKIHKTAPWIHIYILAFGRLKQGRPGCSDTDHYQPTFHTKCAIRINAL